MIFVHYQTKGGIQLSILKPWRFTICTVVSGQLENHLNQNFAPKRSVNHHLSDAGRIVRGRKKRKLGKKINLVLKTKSNYQSINLEGTKSNQFTTIGALLAAGLLFVSVVGFVPKAYAADNTFAGFAAAKELIINAAPAVTQESASNDSGSTMDYIQKPLIVETQVTVDPPKKSFTTRKKVNPSSITKRLASANLNSNSAHSFPYGYCTYYVSLKRDIPWSGNAISWLSGARSFGYATGSSPKVGAILVTSEGGRTGHVALVDAVNDDGTITLSEMNYAGFGVISSRTISESYGAILGYIY